MLAVGTNSVPIWWGAWNPNPNQHGPAGAIAVGGGLYNDYVVGADSSLWVWGDDTYGQYGNNTQYQNQPGTIRDTVDQSSAYQAVAVASSGSHALLLRNDGTVWAWGDNSVGELGDGAANSFPVLIPSQVTKSNTPGDYLTGVVQIAAGGGGLGEPYSVALASDGTIWVWGSDHEGQLGNGLTNQNVLWATALTTITGVVAIAAAPDGVNTMALKSDGTVWTWGRNNLGNGSTGGSATPVQVTGLTGVAAISVSYSHAIVLKNDGTVWNWGDNAFGEMDNGTTSSTPVLTPIQANTVSGATEVAAGDFYSEVLLSSGAVWGWGTNENYELGTGFMTTPYTFPVQAKTPTTVAQPSPCPLLGVGTGPNPGPSVNEMLGGGPIDELPVAPNCCHGVTPAIGNFYTTNTDLSIPGRGVQLNFTRTYNSLMAAQGGPLGNGWTDNYNVFVMFDPSGNPTVHEENGATISFTLVSGVYQPPSRVLATFVKNGDGTYTLNRRFQVHLTFNSAGQLVSLTDRNNVATSLSYTAGQLSSVADRWGRTLTFGYQNGLLHTVTDNASPTQRKVQFDYLDGNGNLTQVTDIAGGVTKYSYDVSHMMQSVTDPRTDCTCILKMAIDDVSGRISTETNQDGVNTTSFTYGVNSTTIQNPDGDLIAEHYQNNALVSRTLAYQTAESVTSIYSYDSVTQGVTAITDPAGHTSTYTWYPTGYEHSYTDPLQHGVSFTYDSLNDMLTATDALQVTTTYKYDAAGNILSVSTPLVGSSQTQVTSYAHADSAHPADVTSVTDADLFVWSFSYDASGDLTSATDPLGDQTTYFYDNVGRLYGSEAPLSNCSGCQPNWGRAYGTNAWGDQTSFSDPMHDLTTHAYDFSRNLTQITDPNNYNTILGYDFDNQLRTVTSGAGTSATTTITTTYDGNGNVLTQQDGRGKTTTFAYDSLNYRRTATDPLKRVTGYGYDPLGNLTSVESPNGPTTVLGHDAAGRVTSIHYYGTATPTVTYTFDNDNQRLTMSDGSGTATYTVDSLHRVTQVSNGAGQVTKYGYDLKGQLTSITYPGGSNTVTRTYDKAGRLATVTDWLKHTTTYNYDLNSNLAKEIYPNGITAYYVPDLADRLGTINDYKGTTLIFAWSYGRDPDSNLCNVGGPACMPGSMGPYDPLDRQTVAQNTTYGYDQAGNLFQNTFSSYTSTLTFDDAEQASTFTEMNGSTLVKKLTYTFDSNGNRTAETDQNNAITSFSYDQANRLTRYSSGSTTATYKYDGDGLRVSKTIGTGSPESYVWNAAESTSAPLVDGATSYVTGFGGMVIEQITSSGTVYYYHQDQLGSTGDITDSKGRVVNTYSYDSYGNVMGSTGTLANPIQFAGQYVDSESGLHYLKARYYEPAPIGLQNGQTVSALFLTKDPFGDGRQSSYSYAAGSPQNATDPNGLWPDWQAGWNALAAGAKDIGRQGAIMSLTAAGNWVGGEHDDLASGDPVRVGKGILGVGLVVSMVIPGVGEAEGGVDAVALATEEARAGANLAEHGPDLALGLTRSETTEEKLLQPFADQVGARTWSEPPFSDVWSGVRRGGGSVDQANEAIIDYAVAGGGRIHFNLTELDPSRGGYTAHELEYVCGSPALRSATTFYGGPAPC